MAFDDLGGEEITNEHMAAVARVGDQVEARWLHGQPARRVEIVELLGSAGHKHYRARWDEQHESIVYPGDGVIITRRATGRAALAEESD